MKNKNLFFIIYIAFITILIVSIITLYCLGKKERIGYLSEFKFDKNHINRTLELNGYNITDVKESLTIDNKLNNADIINYIFTNKSITNYSYGFRIKYYSKVFRNNDIYGVYIDTNKILEDNNFIKEINMDGDGSPFGNLISTKIIDFEKIDNINYKLKLKYKFVFTIIIILLMVLIAFIYVEAILLKKNFFFNKKLYILYICSSFILLFLIILSILGAKERNGYFSIYQLDTYGTLIVNNISRVDLQEIFKDAYDKEIKNFIYTNNSIKKYQYGFQIKYYDKIFTNNHIYNVYPNIDNIIKKNAFIKEINMLYKGSSFGALISDKIIKNDKINNINYYLKLKDHFIILIIILTAILLNACFKKINLYIKKNNRKLYAAYLYFNKLINNYFIIITLIISIILIIFHFWLLRPGYFAYPDNMAVLSIGVVLKFQNWWPVIIQVFQAILNRIFGYHTFYIFLVNIICWYISLFFIIISAYKIIKSKKTLLIFFISFIINIFFMNTMHDKDVTAIAYLLLAYSLIFFVISFNIKSRKILILITIAIAIILILSLLWKHNMIVSIYPIFILFTFILLRKIQNKLIYSIYFISIMLISAVLLISILKITPYIFVREKENIELSSRASIHLIMFQIAAIATISDDGSLIPDNWYYKGKDFDYVKELYSNNRYDGDLYFGDERVRPFKLYDIDDYNIVLLKYVLKHPISFIKHNIEYLSKMFVLKVHLLDSRAIQTKSDIFATAHYYDTNGITFDKTRENIYNFLYYNLIEINVIFFIITSFIIFITTFVIWIFNKYLRTTMLLFIFCVSFSCTSTAIIVSFTPILLYRYIYPVIPISILALIGFITFIYDKGGFKKIIKELRGKK